MWRWSAPSGTVRAGTPVIISGDDDGTVRVWRTADGTSVGEALTGTLEPGTYFAEDLRDLGVERQHGHGAQDALADVAEVPLPCR